MNQFGSHSVVEQLRLFGREVRARDFHLTLWYLLGICATAVFLALPYQLTRVGGALIVIALGYMIYRVRQAHREPRDAASYTILDRELIRIDARLAVARSAFYTVPFLVGANLVFMGLPVGGTALQEAFLDCVFLGFTVAAFLFSYCFNQHVIRRELLPIQRELARNEENRLEAERS